MDEFAILFCRPGPGSRMDDNFELEADAVDSLGIETHVINADLVVDGEPQLAVQGMSLCGKPWLYRGPILTADEYTGLYDALEEVGASLIVDAGSYEHGMYLPEHYEVIEDITPPARWTYGTDIDEAWDAAREMGPPPWLIKDHVKSAKEDWNGACFIPAGANRKDFGDVAEGLLDCRGERFERGFVIRKFVDLATSGIRTSDRRIPEEHRLFFWHGQLVAHAPYHPIGSALTDTAPFDVIGSRIDSPFFTADIAFLNDGGWIVVEINDGGASTLPEDLHPRALYTAMLGL